MYERLTDRARKAMQLANREAQRFNHEYIGTEHILLGLAKEGKGMAANVLKNLGTDLCKICIEVEKVVCAGPDTSVPARLPMTPRAKKVIECSIAEARNLNHNYVGTEHLLLGLLREQDGVAAQVLTGVGLEEEAVRKELLSLLGQADPCESGKEPGQSQAPRRFRKKPVVVEAAQWFKSGDHPEVGDVRRQLGTTPCAQCGVPMVRHGWIATLEGGHIVCPGDWIITGVAGEHYPCKPGIFEATYEPVE